MRTLFILSLAALFLCFEEGAGMAMTEPTKDYEVVYSWVTLDYNWINESMKQEYIEKDKYVFQTNVPSGIKVYKGEVYVTVPRWFHGVPATLNKVVMSKDNSPVMQPYPSWDVHTIGDCNSFQFVQATEIDPKTGLMWIVDTGRSGIFNPQVTKNSCQAKIVVFDIEKEKEVLRYTFPDTVVSRDANYLNDIVLDKVDGKVAYAYITDTGTPGLVVYDVENNTSYRFEDASTMSSEKNKPIYIDGRPFDPQVPINGIAMSADFRYVYFSAVSGTSLYQVPTSALRNPKSDITRAIRKVGEKPSQGDGMVYGSNNLYFGGLNDSSVYRWEVSKDVKAAEGMLEGNVALNSVTPILRDEAMMAWIDTFAIDELGYLWFTSSNVGRVFMGSLNYTSTTPNYRILKTNIREGSYLNQVISIMSDSSNNLTPVVWKQLIPLVFIYCRCT